MVLSNAVAVKNRFETLEKEGETKWNTLKEALVTTAKQVIPKKESSSKNKWMTDEILELMKKRQQIFERRSLEYKTMSKQIGTKCREAKEVQLNGKCQKIEQCKNAELTSMHKKIKEITGYKRCTSTGCIKSKEGIVIMEKDEILKWWTEYIGELFQDSRREKPVIQKTMDGPKILKSEVQATVNKMKKNKAAGPDEIVTEMITALEDFGTEKLTDVINEVYNSGDIPEDLSKSIFIALPKKPGATEYELHRTISLMSHIIKIILRIIMMRARSKTKAEIGEEQFGFVQDAGTRNAIFMVRMLTERAIEMQRDLFCVLLIIPKRLTRCSTKNC